MVCNLTTRKFLQESLSPRQERRRWGATVLWQMQRLDVWGCWSQLGIKVLSWPGWCQRCANLPLETDGCVFSSLCCHAGLSCLCMCVFLMCFVIFVVSCYVCCNCCYVVMCLVMLCRHAGSCDLCFLLFFMLVITVSSFGQYGFCVLRLYFLQWPNMTNNETQTCKKSDNQDNEKKQKMRERDLL